METDRTLFPFGLPGHHGLGTEMDAAIAAHATAGALRQRVLDALQERGSEGLTYCEAQGVLGLASAQQRLSDLVHLGLAVDSGRRRRTPRGAWATVWVASEAPGPGR